MSKTKYRLFYLLAVTTIFVSCKQKHKEKEEPNTYKVTSPLLIDTAFNKEYVAQIQSVRNIEVRSQEKGFLQNIYVDEGQIVHAGQLLFRIMPKINEAEVMKAKAEVLKSNANILKAKAEIKSVETELLNTSLLAKKEIVSKSELVVSQSKLEGAKAELAAMYSELEHAKAELALAETHLSFTEIKAPYSGIIDRIRLKLGSLIDEGALLTTLSDNNNVFAYFNLPEVEYLNYKAHATDNTSTVNLRLANGDMHQFPGVIETIEGEFDNETGNIAFRAKFPNGKYLLKHGETGKVLMRVALNNALVIPQKATYELQDKMYVYVVDENHVVKTRNITIKSRLPELFVVDSGLEKGDKILIEGLQKVKEDDKIEYTFEDPRNIINHLQLINNN